VDLSAVVETNGTLNIQSGASVTSNVLFVAPNAVANIGTITITGAGSALTLNGAATATIGATSSSIATVNVENGGTFTTGTGLTTVNATGDLNVNTGGTMIVRGDMIVYSSLDIAGGGTVILEASAPAPTEEIGGLVAGTQYDRVNVGGTLFADGTLDVDLLAGYTPHFGDAFDLIDAGNFAGAFDTIALPDLPGGLTLGRVATSNHWRTPRRARARRRATRFPWNRAARPVPSTPRPKPDSRGSRNQNGNRRPIAAVTPRIAERRYRMECCLDHLQQYRGRIHHHRPAGHHRRRGWHHQQRRRPANHHRASHALRERELHRRAWRSRIQQREHRRAHAHDRRRE
jgi:hypothetical protein